MIEFRPDDLTDQRVRRLVAHHLAGVRGTSPAENVFALDIDELISPDITFWSGWERDDLVVIGALRHLGSGDGEIKSMRVADQYLGTGAGRAMLGHIQSAARSHSMSALWLETGSDPAFTPARRLYAAEGFTECGPFGDYRANPFSIFMMKSLDG